LCFFRIKKGKVFFLKKIILQAGNIATSGAVSQKVKSAAIYGYVANFRFRAKDRPFVSRHPHTRTPALVAEKTRKFFSKNFVRRKCRSAISEDLL
jgi:hypothetical protein